MKRIVKLVAVGIVSLSVVACAKGKGEEQSPDVEFKTLTHNVLEQASPVLAQMGYGDEKRVEVIESHQEDMIKDAWGHVTGPYICDAVAQIALPYAVNLAVQTKAQVSAIDEYRGFTFDNTEVRELLEEAKNHGVDLDTVIENGANNVIYDYGEGYYMSLGAMSTACDNMYQ